MRVHYKRSRSKAGLFRLTGGPEKNIVETDIA